PQDDRGQFYREDAGKSCFRQNGPWRLARSTRQTMHLLRRLRHAKSSWKEEVEDHERRLNRRGREAARRVGRALPAAVGTLDLVLCSSARRTRETLELIVAEFTVRPRSVLEDELYEASKDQLMERLRRLAQEI